MSNVQCDNIAVSICFYSYAVVRELFASATAFSAYLAVERYGQDQLSAKWVSVIHLSESHVIFY
jgi:hypothetical protein